MNKKQYSIDSRNPEKLVKEQFSASYMNNTKWFELIEKLTDTFNQVYLRYKLIYSNEVKGYLFDIVDFEPFFIEPITYKDIEWIEIPSLYEKWINANNRKAGKKLYHQDLIRMKNTINEIGQFEHDIEIKSIRIYGYKK